MLHTNGHTSTNSTRRAAGFSAIELLAGLLIMGVVIAIAIVQLQPAIQQIRANTAMYIVSTTLRWSRQSAISHRRNFQVQFLGSNRIQVFRQEQPVPTLTLVRDVYLNPTVTFQLTAGMPDTPDGYGNGAAILFGGQAGGPPVMQFQSDGEFIDGNGNAINGTVFMGIPGIQTCARAVTVLGTTGRVRDFKGNGIGWILAQ